MVSINTNLSSLLVQNSLSKSTNALNQAIERMTTGFKINHASDNAANYSISTDYSSKISSYEVAMDNAAMGSDMLAYADDTLTNMSNNAARLRELCVQAQNGTYGIDSINAMKAEANSLISHIVNQYKSAEYNDIQIFDIYSDHLAELQSNSATPATPIGLTSDISPQYDGFIDNPVTYTDEQIAEMLANNTMKELSSVRATDTISSGKYLISSEDELVKLATMTNAGKITSNSVEFVLGADIDISSYCAEHTAANGTGGWTAIGLSTGKSFKGTFDGNGHTVSGLYINKETDITGYQGLFGYIDSGSIIKNVGVDGCDVKGRRNTGGLAGNIYGSIINSYVIGNVSGRDSYTGGLAGQVSGSITNSYVAGNVSGSGSYTGGLAGQVSGSITNSYVAGNVSGSSNYVGGLAGYTSNSIINSYVIGNVSGATSIGGLVGGHCGGNSIRNSYTTGNVSGTSIVGGLVGETTGCTIENSYSTGDISGTTYVGGILGIGGYYQGNVTIKNTMSTGKISGDTDVGGISGYLDFPNESIITNVAFNTGVNSGVSAVGNGSYSITDLTEINSLTNLQVGINGDESSQITTSTNLNIGIIKQLETLNIASSSSLDFMDKFLEALSSKATEIGAAQNRIMSAMDSITVSIENLTSSRSTIKDADIAKVSSEYIRHQILQQASATLLATANQTPSIALQLL